MKVHIGSFAEWACYVLSVACGVEKKCPSHVLIGPEIVENQNVKFESFVPKCRLSTTKKANIILPTKWYEWLRTVWFDNTTQFCWFGCKRQCDFLA